jgi:hypothetical protein
VCSLELAFDEPLIQELRSRTLGTLGYTEAADPAILTTLDDALAVAAKFVRPKGTYRILPVIGSTREGVETQAGTVRSALFARLVGMCEGDRSLLFMMVTLGDALERTCSAEDPVHRQLVFDTLGSELVEMVADILESEWRAHLEGLGLQSSQRFSPGYCDWALDGQAVIDACLDATRVGVQLTPHFVMVPRKSVSAIAAVAPKIPVSAPCVFCARDDCQDRRLPRSSGI